VNRENPPATAGGSDPNFMSAPTAETAQRSSGIFYGWWIVVISTLALLISNGLSIGGLPVFYKPIQEDLLALGAVTLETKDRVTGLAAGLTFLLAGIFSLVIGLLVQRFKIKTLMAAGCVVLGSGLLLYSFANSPIFVYASHCLLGLSLGLVGVMIQTVLISNWFRRKRGLAMGIVLTGTSFGGALIPALATPLISSYGWRTAMQTLSLAVWLILLPAVLFFVRDRASDVGAGFDGDAPVANTFGEKPALTGLTLGEALKTPTFWILSLCAALIFYPIFTISQQFNLYLQNSYARNGESRAKRFVYHQHRRQVSFRLALRQIPDTHGHYGLLRRNVFSDSDAARFLDAKQYSSVFDTLRTWLRGNFCCDSNSRS
jgi:MFS family permease